MKTATLWGLAVVLAMTVAGVSPARAQQPAATASPAAASRNWCPQVPETPPPPHYEGTPRDWATVYKYCSSISPEYFRDRPDPLGWYRSAWLMCGRECNTAAALWALSKNPPPPPKKVYRSTTEPQGPIQLPGGTTGYLLPLPTSSPTPAATQTPSAPQGSADPGGSFPGGAFAGADSNAVNDRPPPDVAADVSPTQNVEFVNTLGMHVWAKPTLPIASPAPTPQATLSMNTFWCTGSAINGPLQSRCANGTLLPGYGLTDPQVGYDASLGRWLVTSLDALAPELPHTAQTPDFVYVAVSNTGAATGDPNKWTKWAVPVCTENNSSAPFADQPLLGWGAGFVGVDVVCFDGAGTRREDNLIVVQNSNLTPTPASSLPNPIVPPCIGMTPVRDEDDPALSSLYLVASVVPGDGEIMEPTTCGVNPANKSPYVVEYTATGAGVLDSTGKVCPSNSACTPLSQTGPLWNPGMYDAGAAKQLGCSDTGCRIDANDARIKAAQIRQTNSNGNVSPFLTLAFNTGFQPSVNMTGSQAFWAQQNLTANSWSAFALISDNTWFSYPTTALDADLDLYFGSTWFFSGIHPRMVWDLYSGSNYTFEGQDIIEQSTKEYTGDGNLNADRQKWGDYNTMVYDPNAIGPSGEGVFWSVEEVTCSSLFPNNACPNDTGTTSADESTTWVALEDPAPFFVGSTVAETEEQPICSPYSLTTQISPPSGVQSGDVLIAILLAGTPTPGTTPMLPPGWTLLNMKDFSSTTMTTSGTCGTFSHSQIAVHAFSTSDTTPYSFSFQITPVIDTCDPNFCFPGESAAYLNAYRFASTDFTKYDAYGWENNDTTGSNTTSATAPISSPAERRLLTIFSGVGDEATGDEITGLPCESFSQPTGSPALKVESSLTPDCTLPAFLTTDVWANPNVTLGGYTESPGSLKNGGNSPLPAWQVLIPEPNN